MYSIITPVYRTEEFVTLQIQEFSRLAESIAERFRMQSEFIFVVDGSPDRSFERLREQLPDAPFRSQLILHSKNFGSFAAIRTGLFAARGDFIGIIAADMQEPPDLLVDFLQQMTAAGADVVIGRRTHRDDPASARLAASLFWRIYRSLVVPDLPPGGVDVFGCTRRVRDALLELREAHSSLVAQLFWLGFRRTEVPYARRERKFGTSAWTLRKKLKYLSDSVFAFTDLPIRLLVGIGAVGLILAAVFGFVVAVMRLSGLIEEPGYAATILTVTFFGALNTLGLGIVGEYAWRAYENTKARPQALVSSAEYWDPSPLTRDPAGSR